MALVVAGVALTAGIGVSLALLSSRDGSAPAAAASRTESPPVTGQVVVNREFAQWLTQHAQRNDFNLQVDLGGATKSTGGTWLLKDKDPIKLTVRADRDVYLRIFTLSPDGTVIQLFPSKFEKDDLLRANVERQIPDPNLDTYSMTTTVSTGDEHLFVVATSEPWKSEAKGEEQNGFQVYYREDQLTGFGDDLKRGILVRPKEEGPQVSEASFRYRVLPKSSSR
jgi:hypothetical protein